MKRESYLGVALPPIALALTLFAIARFGLAPAPKIKAPEPVAAKPAEVVKKTPPKRPRPMPLIARRPVRPQKPTIDEAAVRRAEEEFEASRALAEHASKSIQEATAALRSAQEELTSASQAYQALASSPHPSEKALKAASDRGELLKAERDKIEGELLALNEAPRPRRKPLVDKSPVSKRSDGDEFHFEIRGDRVAFIDLERLLDKVKTDAKVQIRLSNGTRPATGTVGPVGAFQIAYEVSRLDDGANPKMGSFGLTGWEILPAYSARGETYSAAMGPASDFARAIRRLNPTHDVVTMWVYPSGFALYRQLRDTLHSQGFLVAARPLPEGVPIRGSPSGSASSAQ